MRLACRSILVQVIVNKPNGIDVEVSSTTLTESSLHSGLVSAVRTSIIEPVGVKGPGGVRKNERVSGRGVSVGDDSDLASDLRVSVQQTLYKTAS